MFDGGIATRTVVPQTRPVGHQGHISAPLNPACGMDKSQKIIFQPSFLIPRQNMEDLPVAWPLLGVVCPRSMYIRDISWNSMLVPVVTRT